MDKSVYTAASRQFLDRQFLDWVRDRVRLRVRVRVAVQELAVQELSCNHIQHCWNQTASRLNCRHNLPKEPAYYLTSTAFTVWLLDSNNLLYRDIQKKHIYSIHVKTIYTRLVYMVHIDTNNCMYVCMYTCIQKSISFHSMWKLTPFYSYRANIMKFQLIHCVQVLWINLYRLLCLFIQKVETIPKHLKFIFCKHPV